MGPAPTRDARIRHLAGLGLSLATLLLIAALLAPWEGPVRGLLGLAGLLGAAAALWVARAPAPTPGTEWAEPEAPEGRPLAAADIPPPAMSPPPPAEGRPPGLRLAEVEGLLWAWAPEGDAARVVAAFCPRCLDPLSLSPIPMGGQATFTSLACAHCGLHRGRAFPGDAEAVRRAVLSALEAGLPAPSRPRGSRRRS